MSAVRRVVAGVSGSPGSLQALRFAVDVGRTTGAWVTPVLAWLPPGGDFADRRHPSAYLRQIWKEDAWQRLWRAIDMGIGGVPADIPFEPVVLRGETGAVLTGVACRSGDVLVIGPAAAAVRSAGWRPGTSAGIAWRTPAVRSRRCRRPAWKRPRTASAAGRCGIAA